MNGQKSFATIIYVALGTCVYPTQFGDIVVKSDGFASFMGSRAEAGDKLIEEVKQYYISRRNHEKA